MGTCEENERNVAVIQESKLGVNRKTTEGMRVAIDVSRNERIIITNVYRPPIRRIEDEDERVNHDVREWLESNENELILGNLNLQAKAKWPGERCFMVV